MFFIFLGFWFICITQFLKSLLFVDPFVEEDVPRFSVSTADRVFRQTEERF